MPSVIDTNRPAPSACNVTLINHQHETIMYHFLVLRPDAAAQQTSQIATVIGQFAHQQHLQYKRPS
jgi:hypothetical protein